VPGCSKNRKKTGKGRPKWAENPAKHRAGQSRVI
jgi:hypothetical protein